VTELVGEDGGQIAVFFFEVMTDPEQRMADRMEAARWLAERGFGKVPTALEGSDPGVPSPIVTERKRTQQRVKELLAIASELGS
jgi:hypothetical protein